jgi:hypothetical protein
LWPSSAIEVYLSSGYDDADLPESIRQGMLLLISLWFNAKLPFEFTPGAPTEIPYTVQYLLSVGAVPRIG